MTYDVIDQCKFWPDRSRPKSVHTSGGAPAGPGERCHLLGSLHNSNAEFSTKPSENANSATNLVIILNFKRLTLQSLCEKHKAVK